MLLFAAFGYCRWESLCLFSSFLLFLRFLRVRGVPTRPQHAASLRVRRRQPKPRWKRRVSLVFLVFLRVRGLPSPLNARRPQTQDTITTREPADTRRFPAPTSRMMLNHSTYGFRGSHVSTAVDVRCAVIVLHALCMRFEGPCVSS